MKTHWSGLRKWTIPNLQRFPNIQMMKCCGQVIGHFLMLTRVWVDHWRCGNTLRMLPNSKHCNANRNMKWQGAMSGQWLSRFKETNSVVLCRSACRLAKSVLLPEYKHTGVKALKMQKIYKLVPPWWLVAKIGGGPNTVTRSLPITSSSAAYLYMISQNLGILISFVFIGYSTFGYLIY